MHVRVAIMSGPRPGGSECLAHTLRALRTYDALADPSAIGVFVDSIDPPDLRLAAGVAGTVRCRTTSELADLSARGIRMGLHNLIRSLEWASGADFAITLEDDVIIGDNAISDAIELVRAAESHAKGTACVVNCHDLHERGVIRKTCEPFMPGPNELFDIGPDYLPNGSQMHAMSQRAARVVLDEIWNIIAHPTAEDIETPGPLLDIAWLRVARSMVGALRYLVVDKCLCDHIYTLPSTWSPECSRQVRENRRTKRFLV
jgi:hypothetical protein